MPESPLGHWLRGLREKQDLSLRDVAQRGEVDHAYVYRLETGAKEAPSDEVIGKLVTALSPSKRDAEILRYLAANSNIEVALVDFVQKDKTVTFDEFRMLTTAVNRGARPDFAVSLARIRRFMREE